MARKIAGKKGMEAAMAGLAERSARPPPAAAAPRDVLARLTSLKSMDAGEMKALWRKLYDHEPPAFNRRYLESRLAWRFQELAFGGLKPETIRKLEKLGEQLDGGKASVRKKKANDRPVAGTCLLREWRGDEYTVTVLADGFEWQGRPYTSLSAVARAITGTNWNGHVFFGLKRATHGAQDNDAVDVDADAAPVDTDDREVLSEPSPGARVRASKGKVLKTVSASKARASAEKAAPAPTRAKARSSVRS